MNSMNNCGAGSAPEAKPEHFHKAFSWVHTDTVTRGTRFIESVADMCAGLQTCLQLVHSTDLALQARAMDDDEAVPVLGSVDKERLLRLAMAVTGVLAEGAHQELEWVNNHARERACSEEAAK